MVQGTSNTPQNNQANYSGPYCIITILAGREVETQGIGLLNAWDLKVFRLEAVSFKSLGLGGLTTLCGGSGQYPKKLAY